MKYTRIAAVALGLVLVTLLTILFPEKTPNLREPHNLSFDVIQIEAQKLREARDAGSFESIILYPDYDPDWISADDIHLVPTAWQNAAGAGDYR